MKFVDFFNQPNLSYLHETNITIEKFVESLNYIVEEKESVCDFNILMKHIKILDLNNYCRLKVTCEYNMKSQKNHQ
jgi:hypothetical protein